MSNPATGPMTPEELKALADAPHGHALQAIRKYDPHYGKFPVGGEPTKWRVKLYKEVEAIGYVIVEASSEEEAEALAEDKDDSEIDWEYDDTGAGFDVEEVKPA